MVTMTAEAAATALRDGTAPAGMVVEDFLSIDHIDGPLTFPDNCRFQVLYVHDIAGPIHWGAGMYCHTLTIYDCPQFTALAGGLSVHTLSISRCPNLTTLATGLTVTDQLEIIACGALETLPDDLHVTDFIVRGTSRWGWNQSQIRMPRLQQFPERVHVAGQFVLRDCPSLAELPASLDLRQAHSIEIVNCPALRAVPHGIQSHYVRMANCTGLTAWDDPDVTFLRQLDMSGCAALRQLPPHLREIDQLDVSGCTVLASLPLRLVVHEWLDIGNTPLQLLPTMPAPVPLRWNGVGISGRVAFHPETITAQMVLAERNAEVRRVMMERMGTERFMAEAEPDLLDQDTDAGGVRRLLKVVLSQDDKEEPLVALQVSDPSTGRGYLLRVPPATATCRQAAAWLAGFDDPEDYHPVIET
jgi:hypothetical protein